MSLACSFLNKGQSFTLSESCSFFLCIQYNLPLKYQSTFPDSSEAPPGTRPWNSSLSCLHTISYLPWWMANVNCPVPTNVKEVRISPFYFLSSPRDFPALFSPNFFCWHWGVMTVRKKGKGRIGDGKPPDSSAHLAVSGSPDCPMVEYHTGRKC